MKRHRPDEPDKLWKSRFDWCHSNTGLMSRWDRSVWRKAVISINAKQPVGWNKSLRASIASAFGDNYQCYGHRRIHTEPWRDGDIISEKIIRRIMREKPSTQDVQNGDTATPIWVKSGRLLRILQAEIFTQMRLTRCGWQISPSSLNGYICIM